MYKPCSRIIIQICYNNTQTCPPPTFIVQLHINQHMTPFLNATQHP